jgi:hypothetical protein
MSGAGAPAGRWQGLPGRPRKMLVVGAVVMPSCVVMRVVCRPVSVMGACAVRAAMGVGGECRTRKKDQSQDEDSFAKHIDPHLNLGAYVNDYAAWSLAARA